MPRTKRPAWMTKNLVAISWVSHLQDAASEMLYPIMPLFLNNVLGAPAAIIGTIEGLAEGAAALTKLGSKYINRVMSRKSMIFIGYALAATGKLLIAIATSWPMVMFARFVDRLGKGTRSAARDAILVQGVATEDRGKVIGFHRTSDTLGAVVGPSLALVLIALFAGDIRSILWIAVIPAIISTIVVLAIRDNDPSTRKIPKVAKNSPVKDFAPLSKNIKSLIWVLTIFSAVNFPDALLLLHLSQENYSVTEVVGLYLLFNISYAALSFPAGLLADRIQPKYVYSLGLVFFAFAYGGLALTANKFAAILLVVLYGCFAAANDVVGKSWVSKLAENNQQLSVQARLQGSTGFAILFAGIWAGVIWNVGPGLGIVPLFISASLGLVAAVFVAATKL